jgi:hypothetical protein
MTEKALVAVIQGRAAERIDGIGGVSTRRGLAGDPQAVREVGHRLAPLRPLA